MGFCRNRKTGFKCPRGCGKGTKHDHACPGKVSAAEYHRIVKVSVCWTLEVLRWMSALTAMRDRPSSFAHTIVAMWRALRPMFVQITKSHPIHIRNDDCKKRKKVCLQALHVCTIFLGFRCSSPSHTKIPLCIQRNQLDLTMLGTCMHDRSCDAGRTSGETGRALCELTAAITI